MSREHRITQVFIELADTLVAEFEVVDFLGYLAGVSVELLDVDAAGLMLADEDGLLHVMASSDDQAELLELFELQQDEGPCPECFRTGVPVVNVELSRWPDFAAAAAAGGYTSAHALPLHLRGHVIGALNLFRTSTEPLTDQDIKLAQALSDIATIGLLHEREIRGHQVLAEQLQHALDSRIEIEQAKGMLAERAGVSPVAAFGAMRSYARGKGLGLSVVAHGVLDGTLQTSALFAR
ncbi:MAG TPA: GAF and ANTAR domain-containing protein [Kribbella sp.]|uniref:GAF and ANTAR domain-containing protein n=1 Tax=Kribbella sp. TaxID=1871183 RepID=UPI002D787A7D|nr:GAF and ANTAR domain-containing protein [Kribbella sp.]HET6299184.1 GAF and ANTAR domain-containing protein [Kribbella sp.]